MGGKWQTYVLGDLTINYDGKRKPVKESERRSGSYPYYGASGIVDYVDDYLIDGDFLLIAEDGENLRTRQTPIAFMARGKSWVNNHAHIVTGNDKADTLFLMYALQAMDISGYLTGAVMPKLTQGNLNRIEVKCPPIIEQRAIAHILGTLDDKIELNRQMNETLEAMAKALFKSWFVKNTQDGDVKMLFGYFVQPKKGKNITKSQVVSGEFPVIAGGLEPSCYHNQSNTMAPVVTISASGANAGFVKLYHTAVWASDSSFIDQSITPYVYFSYIFLKMNQLLLFEKQEGSAQPHIYPRHIMNLEILPISEELIMKYETTVFPYFQKIKNNIYQNNILISLRNALLPKLLSGQIRIKDAEKLMETHC